MLDNDPSIVLDNICSLSIRVVKSNRKKYPLFEENANRALFESRHGGPLDSQPDAPESKYSPARKIVPQGSIFFCVRVSALTTTTKNTHYVTKQTHRKIH